jgi:hypothetical protein
MDTAQSSPAEQMRNREVQTDHPEELEQLERSHAEPNPEDVKTRPAPMPSAERFLTGHAKDAMSRSPGKYLAAHLPRNLVLALGGVVVLFLFWRFLLTTDPPRPAPEPVSEKAVTLVQDPQRTAGGEIQERIAGLIMEAVNLRDQANGSSGEQRIQRLRAASSRIRSVLALDPNHAGAKNLANEIEPEIRRMQDGLSVAERENAFNEGVKTAEAKMAAGNLQEARAGIDELKSLRPNDSRVVALENRYGDLLSTPLALRNWVGLKIGEVTGQKALESGLGTPRGGLVAGVVKGSPAAEAGIQSEDIILEVDYIAVSSALLVPRLIGAKPPGESIHLKVLRGQQTLEIDVAAGPVPESVKKERAAAAAAQLEIKARRERLLQCTARYCPVCENQTDLLDFLSDECLKCGSRFSKEIELCVAQRDNQKP